MTKKELAKLVEDSNILPSATLMEVYTNVEEGIFSDAKTCTIEFSTDAPIIEIKSGSGTLVTLDKWVNNVQFLSKVIAVENPVGETPKSFVASSQYAVNKLTGEVYVVGGSNFNVHYTTKHTVTDDEINVQIGMENSFLLLLVSTICERVALHKAESRMSDISADSVDHRTKSDMYLRLAKEYRTKYLRSVGKSSDKRRFAARAVPYDASEIRTFPEVQRLDQ